jgi:hypothetical protein
MQTKTGLVQKRCKERRKEPRKYSLFPPIVQPPARLAKRRVIQRPNDPLHLESSLSKPCWHTVGKQSIIYAVLLRLRIVLEKDLVPAVVILLRPVKSQTERYGAIHCGLVYVGHVAA